MEIKLKKKDFKAFKREVTAHVSMFGITEWRVYFEFSPLSGANGECRADLLGMKAVISLNPVIEVADNGRSTDEHVKEIAIHEALELLVIPLDIIARYRYATADEVNTHRHTLVNRIHKLLQTR